MYDPISNKWNLEPKMEKLQKEKTAAVELQKRKHLDWDDNYLLYRNKVKTNRLTQRQAVNIPLMKETIKTMLAKIDEAPNIKWQDRGGDQQKEIYYQEIWNKHLIDNNLELIDILDKKNVLINGYSVKKLNINDNGVTSDVLDAYDVLIDPLMNVWDIESARFIIHRNIFRCIRDILVDDRYTEEGKNNLKIWADSPQGILQSGKNKEEWEAKMERLKAMGVNSGDFPYYAGGDMVVNLTEHFTRIWDTKKGKYVKRVIVYAEDNIELSDNTLKDLIGVDFWPFIRWAEDPEVNDIYPDSVADLVRTPNKVLNIWFSQLIENRTLKNFQMHWFLPSQNYTPQTYTPAPGVMLPAPPGDDINKVIKPVEVSGLDDTLTAIQQVVNIVERGTGATAIEKGESEKGQQTLGEVQILVGKAQERTLAISKFYRLAWAEYARKWDSLMHANAPKLIKLSKTNNKGRAFEKNLMASDWKSELGYNPIVSSTSEQEQDSVKTIQRFMFILSQFPQNISLRKIAQKRMLESVDLSPEELREVEEGEKQINKENNINPLGMPEITAPDESQLGQIVQNKMAQLAA
jgi:hypothetical protein